MTADNMVERHADINEELKPQSASNRQDDEHHRVVRPSRCLSQMTCVIIQPILIGKT
jgi:hypothetical protein